MLELLEPVGGVLGQVLRGSGLGRCGSLTLPPMTMFSSARRACSLVAASACSVLSRRFSQVSMSTFSLRMRMPPDEWPMVQRTDAPSTSASNGSSPSVTRTDLISSDLRKRPPARSTAKRSPSSVGELGGQELEHDARVGAVRRQL